MKPIPADTTCVPGLIDHNTLSFRATYYSMKRLQADGAAEETRASTLDLHFLKFGLFCSDRGDCERLYCRDPFSYWMLVLPAQPGRKSAALNAA